MSDGNRIERALALQDAQDKPTCIMCNTREGLRCCPIATGDKFGEPTKYPVCQPCLNSWYDGGGTTPEEILRDRFPEEFDHDHD